MAVTPLEVLQKYGIEQRQHSDRASNAGENWIQVDCPFCSPNSGKFRLGVHRYTGSWNCWLCGPHYRTEAWAAVLHIEPARARTITAGMPRDAIPEATQHKGKLVLPEGLGPLLPAHKRYLVKRGFDPEVLASLWGVQGIGPLGLGLAWRVFIPITLRGVTVSWTTRAIVDTGMRYIAAGEDREAVRGKSLLLGIDYVQHACVVHEGPMDAYKTGPGAVSLCGIAYTTAQVRLLAEVPRRVLCFDSEPIAQQRASKLADALSVYPGTTHIAKLESGKDAGDADPAELLELRKFAGIENVGICC